MGPAHTCSIGSGMGGKQVHSRSKHIGRFWSWKVRGSEGFRSKGKVFQGTWKSLSSEGIWRFWTEFGKFRRVWILSFSKLPKALQVFRSFLKFLKVLVCRKFFQVGGQLVWSMLQCAQCAEFHAIGVDQWHTTPFWIPPELLLICNANGNGKRSETCPFAQTCTVSRGETQRHSYKSLELFLICPLPLPPQNLRLLIDTVLCAASPEKAAVILSCHILNNQSCISGAAGKPWKVPYERKRVRIQLLSAQD